MRGSEAVVHVGLITDAICDLLIHWSLGVPLQCVGLDGHGGVAYAAVFFSVESEGRVVQPVGHL